MEPHSVKYNTITNNLVEATTSATSEELSWRLFSVDGNQINHTIIRNSFINNTLQSQSSTNYPVRLFANFAHAGTIDENFYDGNTSSGGLPEYAGLWQIGKNTDGLTFSEWQAAGYDTNQNQDQDSDEYTRDLDCNDNDASIYPGATDIPYDGIDQDCNGSDLTDVDGDTYSVGPDCNDNDAAINPGATETPYDGIDQNCSGSDLTDVDGDGYTGTEASGDDCNDSDAAIYPGAAEVRFDTIDQDCNGHDLTIDITRAEYLTKGKDRKKLLVWATSNLNVNAHLVLNGWGAMSWNNDNQRWEYLSGDTAKPATVTVSGVEGAWNAVVQ